MESDAIRDRLMKICIKTLNRSEMEITSFGANFRNLGADSLDVLEIVTNAEDAFGVVLGTKDFEDFEAVVTFNALLGVIQRKLPRNPRNKDHEEGQASGFSTESKIRHPSSD